MDTSSVSRVLPAADALAPRQAASKAPTPSEIPSEKTVEQVKNTDAGTLNERRQEAEQQADVQSKRERRYELQEHIYVYSVSDAKTGEKVVQFPSEQAVKLRAYLAAEAAKDQHNQEVQKEHLDIVA